MKTLLVALLLVTPAWGAWGLVDSDVTAGTGGAGSVQSIFLDCAGATGYAVTMSGWTGASIATPKFGGSGGTSFANCTSPDSQDGGAGTRNRTCWHEVAGVNGIEIYSATPYGGMVAACFSGTSAADISGISNASGLMTLNPAAAALELFIAGAAHDEAAIATCDGTLIGQLPQNQGSGGDPRSFGVAMCVKNSVVGSNTISFSGVTTTYTSSGVILTLGGGPPPPTTQRKARITQSQ